MCAVLCDGGTMHANDATHMSRVQVTHLRFFVNLLVCSNVYQSQLHCTRCFDDESEILLYNINVQMP